MVPLKEPQKKEYKEIKPPYIFVGKNKTQKPPGLGMAWTILAGKWPEQSAQPDQLQRQPALPAEPVLWRLLRPQETVYEKPMVSVYQQRPYLALAIHPYQNQEGRNRRGVFRRFSVPSSKAFGALGFAHLSSSFPYAHIKHAAPLM